ncbi:hypothetical protein [Paracoccus sp. TOH]|uniref:hypothetical protein n=1 Tax=Paracoccus sp. TOH TaxID=1263728 RepID=UPI0025B186E8|nr:hypothetical protein [Paracoccus sp. TOH]WJS86243.1 hypothetical protein NBE95_12670 [Paracoccus sp. TOH]
MLDAVGRACRILAQEGVSGAVNRLRYRRDGRLMQGRRVGAGRQGFVLLGEGRLMAGFRRELARRGLLGQVSRPGATRKIFFNPHPAEFHDPKLAAAVLDDDYFAALHPGDEEARAGLCSGCPLIVTSVAGLHRVQALGAALRDVTLIPGQARRHGLRLAVGRWLVYADALAPDDYLADLLALTPPIRSRDRICISLPEYTGRRAHFESANPSDFRLFNGIRLLPAWQGCAWSYKAIAAKALQSGARRLTICEDDAWFAADFSACFKAINRYLDRSRWDVFNGVMTRIEGEPDIRLRRRLGRNHIIHTPHMMGMVFNVYNRTALEWMADWSPDAGGAGTNTIDEWMNAMPGLKVVSAVPFIAGHREDAHSTIFGFKNARYSGMIRATEREILSRIEPV